MTHRAEQIIAAVVTNVTGLTTTTTNVNRGRSTPQDAASVDWLDVYMGSDDPIDDDDQAWGFTDSELTIYIDINCKNNSAQIDTQLNLIRSEITVALWQDYQQGLPNIVIDMKRPSFDKPEINGESGKITATMRSTWVFKYRSSQTNPDV